jgi:hypothetical protein
MIDPLREPARIAFCGDWHMKGYGPVAVTGLDCDGSSLDRNVQIFSPERAG